MIHPLLINTLFKNGQFTIPVQIRKKLGLKPGDKVNFTLKDNEVIMQKAQQIKGLGQNQIRQKI